MYRRSCGSMAIARGRTKSPGWTPPRPQTRWGVSPVRAQPGRPTANMATRQSGARTRRIGTSGLTFDGLESRGDAGVAVNVPARNDHDNWPRPSPNVDSTVGAEGTRWSKRFNAWWTGTGLLALRST